MNYKLTCTGGVLLPVLYHDFVSPNDEAAIEVAVKWSELIAKGSGYYRFALWRGDQKHAHQWSVEMRPHICGG